MSLTKSATIREGEKKDLPQVLELIRELAAFTGYSHQVVNTVEMMEKDGFGEKPIYGFLVAEVDSNIIGASIYYYRYSTWKGKRLYLEDLIVKEMYRSKGIGTLLFEATMKKSVETNCSGMMWQVLHWNKNAIKFYEKYNSKIDKEFINCSLEEDQIKSLIN